MTMIPRAVPGKARQNPAHETAPFPTSGWGCGVPGSEKRPLNDNPGRDRQTVGFFVGASGPFGAVSYQQNQEGLPVAVPLCCQLHRVQRQNDCVHTLLSLTSW